MAASLPHHRSPASAIKPAGQDLRAPLAPKSDDSTAPIAAECQSFLQPPEVATDPRPHLNGLLVTPPGSTKCSAFLLDRQVEIDTLFGSPKSGQMPIKLRKQRGKAEESLEDPGSRMQLVCTQLQSWIRSQPWAMSGFTSCSLSRKVPSLRALMQRPSIV